MRRLQGTVLMICLAVGLTAQAQSLFPKSTTASGSARLEVVGTDFTYPLPMRNCDPYSYYPDPSCDPTPTGPNYGAGTSNFNQQHFVPHILSGGGFITIITIT